VNDFAYPNPAQWLRGYQDARFVITDSFHGTVFSILFNIPFLAIGNKNRGLARFQSLLNMFNLSDRLITDLSNFDSDTFIQKEIDWSKVNGVLDQQRKKATDFLRTNLQ
jgi:exopolysaccharide biosynthesis predicted pyruvyltransferase EpsI